MRKLLLFMAKLTIIGAWVVAIARLTHPALGVLAAFIICMWSIDNWE